MAAKEWCVWFTGLPCSGKTTLAKALIFELIKQTSKIVWLDGDRTRKTFGKGLGFSKEDRHINIQRVIGVAAHLTNQGQNVLCSYISPYETVREEIKKVMDHVLIVHVDCPASVCAERDVKGMWALANQGKIQDFTGVSAPYEKPVNPDIYLRTDIQSIKACVQQIFEIMKGRRYL